jgi:hypothetical protein
LPAKALIFDKINLIAQQIVAAYRLDFPTETEKILPHQHCYFDGGSMKVLLVALTLLFSTAILLIAGFQFIRLFVSELIEMVAEAWHSPELPSSH